MPQKTPIISLTPPERLFRQCLLDCRNEMSGVPGMKGLVLRWTGGWVRDKLLGKASNDIDVALSTMTGMQFGQALKRYMVKHGQRYEKEAEAGGFKAEIKNLHKIAANPEKSKHLETITTKMFGIDVDFVNLRKEVYDDVSRNPQMEFGTAEEDASRRDATINALFYNLDDQCVEDYTGQGLADMQQKIIRTPLAPFQTFKDDPLRVLRLIRFATRLGYDIETEAMRSMEDVSIHEALRSKISRERVGVEIGKVVSGPDPHRGLMLIYELGLYDTVFAEPLRNLTPNTRKQPQVFDRLAMVLSRNSAIRVGLRPMEDLGLTWTLAAYVPWKHSEIDAVAAARGAIRATNILCRVLGGAVRNRTVLRALAQSVEQGVTRRGLVGMTLRNTGPTWPSQVMYTLLCDMEDEPYETVVDRYEAFLRWLSDENMMNAHALQPIMNGNQIKQAMNVTHAGAWLRLAIDTLVEWQYDNPTGTLEEAQTFLQSRRDEFVRIV